jgi:hypothetical protein
MSESVIDRRAEANMPWASRNSWRVANQAIDYHLQRYRTDMIQPKMRAQALKLGLNVVFTDMNDLCAHSCPWCPEPCCLIASVWFDFKDLLFLHFNRLSIPACQPKANLESTCRYLGSKGCRLPRINRPWICTWYLCPTQTARLSKAPQRKHKLLDQAVGRIKSERNWLESEYIRIIT